MSIIAQVVDGEASESETEIEIGKTPETDIKHNLEPFVIAGEAPESDDESRISIPASISESFTVDTPDTPTKQPINFTSLLHQKLWECNVSLRASLEGLLRYTTEINIEKLTRADKMLLSVQESMRSTNANLTVARARLKQLQTGLENVNCSSALPNPFISYCWAKASSLFKGRFRAYSTMLLLCVLAEVSGLWNLDLKHANPEVKDKGKDQSKY